MYVSGELRLASQYVCMSVVSSVTGGSVWSYVSGELRLAAQYVCMSVVSSVTGGSVCLYVSCELSDWRLSMFVCQR